MYSNAFRGVRCTVLFLLAWSAVTPRECPAQGGASLRYRWPAGAGVGYEVEVTADSPSAVETYKGRIAYTLASQEGDVLKVTFNGGLAKSEKAKRRPGDDDPRLGPFGRMPGPPMGPFAQNPFPGVGHAKNELQMTARGHIRSLEGNSQLPWLLGHLSLLILEPLPEGNETTWKVDSGVTITEGRDDDRFGRFGRFGPFGPRSPEKQSSGSVVTSYSVQPGQGDLAVITKKFQLKSPGDESFDIDGTGTWTFNRKLGVPESSDFQQKLTTTEKNVTVTVPMTIKFRRLSEDEWKKIQEDERQQREKQQREMAETQKKAAEKAKADAVIPLTPAEKQALLGDVKSGDFWRKKGALEKLAAKEPKAGDPQLGEVIYPATKDENVFIRNAAFAALKKWAPELSRKAELNRAYLSGDGKIEPPNRPVTDKTPLPVGLIVCARDHWGWKGAEVREVLANGKVKIKFRGHDPWGHEMARADLQLAPDEVEQPNLDEATLASLRGGSGTDVATPAAGLRVWKDASGTFAVEAQFLGIAEGKVQLKRKDGREIKVPLDRLSKADQEEVKKLQQAPKPENPFE